MSRFLRIKFVWLNCLLVIFCNVNFTKVAAQNLSNTFSIDTVKSSLNIYGAYQINSSALTNELYKTVYKGLFISDDIKDNVYEKLKRNNRVGADARFGMEVAYTPDSLGKKKFGKKLFLSFMQCYQYNASFSGDLLKLILSGNHQFVGQNVSANGLSFNYLNYRKYSMGMRVIDNDAMKLDASVSYFEGLSLFKFKANNANIYTANNYANINVDANYSLIKSDTASHKAKYPKGRGAGLNVFGVTQIKNSTLYFSVENFGFIAWDKNTLQCNKDTAFDYDGVHVDSLIQNTDTSSHGFTLANVKNDFFQFTKSRRTLMLPFEIRLAMDFPILKNLTLTESVYWRYASDFKPYWLNQFNYSISPKYKCGLGLAYGGWGKFSTNVSFSCHPIKPFIISVYASGLEHFATPSTSGGQGLFIKLQYVLR